MKTYNVGVETKDGQKLGWFVAERTADEAIDRVKVFCAANGIRLMPGWMTQPRDPLEENNSYFDRNYKQMGMLL